MMSRNQSPCLTCTRVEDPNKCENKTCKLWQNWFLGRWEAMRERLGFNTVEEEEMEEEQDG